MIYACKETREAWSSIEAKDRGRSLVSDRLVDFKNDERDDDWRKRTSNAIRQGKASNDKIRHWRSFVLSLAEKPERLLFAKLQARLIVNAAGGVMENGGMCLDRNSGIPFIPGSAVKGCARRYAIAELKDAENAKKAELLEQIALIFGWTEMDWKTGKNAKDQYFSDFRWACGDAEVILEEASCRLAKKFGIELKQDVPAWLQIPNVGGAVNFLPAYPWEQDPGIDLDIITCHHQKYYPGDDPAFANAPDTEQPVPVVFPVVSVAKQPVFVFTLLPNRHGAPGLEALARRWLSDGLQTFGIGGKTSAGYGWFDCSAEVQRAMLLEASKRVEEDQRRRKLVEEERVAESRRQAMPPHERALDEYSKMADEPFANTARKFDELSEDQRHGFVLALRQKKDTVKRWAKKKPELLKPWQEFARKLSPPIGLP